MILLTTIAKTNDGLILCESSESLDEYRSQDYAKKSKDIIRSLSYSTSHTLKIESGPCYFLYLIKSDVCFLALCEKSFPRTLAYGYLNELSNEFHQRFGQEVASANRPYHFIKFEPFIQRLKKSYNDSRSNKMLGKVTEELQMAHDIMTKNFSELIDRGEQINSVSIKSSNLREESEKFSRLARDVNSPKFFQKHWLKITVSVLTFLFVLYWRFLM
eukprot:TRINITY_DN645_c0_g1_i1.p1 TRINITY_DN645_c0_g1~~TRINITY_DN645_c0_g1_i1.p1  ORF type:complete len:216 (-),score=96.00 TRINITY_DN645_c0_g1_i1:80-727(-)